MSPLLVIAASGALGATAENPPPVPRTTPPIVYTINYSGDYFTRPDYIEQFKAAPPDLLHVGKATPITHLWGPVRLYQGENQYTGGPNHTLSWENIALLSPEALARRIETIRHTLRRYHAIGIPEIAPYISYHTIAGDHQKRKGFWEFYDRWDAYAKWAGPRPPRDPFEWLAVDARGKFLPGSCGGYSPLYYAPLHRYRACINHPDWAEWHRRLVRMVAEVGYDGCFVDNSHPDPCFCRHCRALFRKFLDQNHSLAWVRRLTKGLDFAALGLDSPEVPPELIRRWRVLRTGQHLGMLRQIGRKVKPGFTIFPNSGRINECLQVGAHCDRLMFESAFSPGIFCAGTPPQSEDVAIAASPDPVEPKTFVHRYELNDPTTWMEMQADFVLPASVQAGTAARLEVRVASVGASLRDEDAAEDFHLVLRCGDEATRVDLQPTGAIGGTGSSRKPSQPPATLAATWTPRRPGRYTISFGFRYTDDSHPETTLRPWLDKLTWGIVCHTHMANLLFARRMEAKPIYLNYEARRSGWENVQELALAEMAAFSGGGGLAGRGEPQAEYRAFFKKYPELFDGWEPTADAAVLYAYWGPNPLDTHKPWPRPTIADHLGATHRPFVALVDRFLPEKAATLARFRVIYLPSPAYETSETQLAALHDFARRGGHLVVTADKMLINGAPAEQRFVRWSWERPVAPTASLAPNDGLRRNLRFALYRKGDRLALHAVNYNLCLLDPEKKVLEVPPTQVTVPLPNGWTTTVATCYSPDAHPRELRCRLAHGAARFVLPRTRIYHIVVLEKKTPS